MKKVLSFCAAFIAAASFQASAQLVPALDMSTGYDNVSATVMPNGMQDAGWQIVSLNPPFMPFTAMPYGSFVQDPWSLGMPGYDPIVPSGSKWLSFDPSSMTVGVNDGGGTGQIVFRYTFELCGKDRITFRDLMLSDNYINDVRVDGLTTGFFQSNTSANWSSGSLFSYSITLLPGVHYLDVYVNNSGTSNPNNPCGLDVQGTISGTTASIIDRDNFPNYVCQQGKPEGTTGVQALASGEFSGGLRQNAPNPFGSSTVISYNTGSMNQSASLVIMDMAGRQVLSFPIESQGAGSISVNSDKLSPGTYIYSLIVDGKRIDSKRMIFTK